MRVSISIIAVIVVAALTWFALRPTATQTTEKIVTEVTPSKTVKEESRIVVAPRPKAVTDTHAEIVETTETVTNSAQIVAIYQEAAPVQEESTITKPEDDIVNFLSNQIQNESLFGLLIQKQIIERFVIFIDNIPRKNLARKFLPIKPPGGLFLSSQNESGEFIAEENHERYYNYVRLIEKIDAEAAIDLYITLYPHFQKR